MDEFDLKIREIKIYRSPETFLDDIFMNLTEYINDDYPDFIFYKIENNLLFDYDLKNNNFGYDYEKIYLILNEKYRCDDLKINNLIKNKVEEHLKLKVKTTPNGIGIMLHWVEEHLKLKVKTTKIQ